MGSHQRDRQLLREAEGYLDLALSDVGGELPLPMRIQLAGRCLHALESLSDKMAQRVHAVMLRGHAFKISERFEEAIACFETAAQIDEENIHIFLALGWCQKRCGRIDLAIRAMEEGILVDPTEAILFYNLACYWALTGNVSQTVVYLGRALELDKRHARSDSSRIGL